tara:strand:+ start:69380 stop:69658 length:279 start_codon:yes stop_codon:yes gene_type:complete
MLYPPPFTFKMVIKKMLFCQSWFLKRNQALSSLWILVELNPVSLQREIVLAHANNLSFPPPTKPTTRKPVSLRRDRKTELAHYFRGGAGIGL